MYRAGKRRTPTLVSKMRTGFHVESVPVCSCRGGSLNASKGKKNDISVKTD